MAYIINLSSRPEVEQLLRAGYEVDHMNADRLYHWNKALGGEFDENSHEEQYDLVPFEHRDWQGYICVFVDCDARNLLKEGLIDGLIENGHSAEAAEFSVNEDHVPACPPLYWVNDSWEHIESTGEKRIYRIAVEVMVELQDRNITIDRYMGNDEWSGLNVDDAGCRDVLKSLEDNGILHQIEQCANDPGWKPNDIDRSDFVTKPDWVD